jgi:tRNA (guanine-N7-)-methyltransferase
MHSQPPIGRVYGRRRGRRLKGRKSELIGPGLEALKIVLPDGSTPFEPAALFSPAPAEIWLEIGFGGGEHLAAQAVLRPDIGFIGCEPFINGVSNLLVLAEDAGLRNIRILNEDARLLLLRLPEGSIGKAFLLFPDPWPKRRHEERRFATAANLDLIAGALADNAEFRVATDHPVLKDWMPGRIAAHPDFAIESRADERPPDWPPTRYESKALAAGRRPIYLTCRRVSRKAG